MKYISEIKDGKPFNRVGYENTTEVRVAQVASLVNVLEVISVMKPNEYVKFSSFTNNAIQIAISEFIQRACK